MLRTHSFVLAALSLLLTTTSARAENRALLVGIGSYKQKYFQGINGPKSTGLPGIDLDVGMMREVVLKMGFQQSQILMLRDEKASLQGLRDAIQRWLIDGVGPNDRVLFYYSGHGAQIPDQEPFDEQDGLDEVIVTWDFEQTANGLRQVFVDDEFAVWLKKIPSQHVMIVLDSCNSGTADKGLPAYAKSVVARDLKESEMVAKTLVYKVQPNYHKGMDTLQSGGSFSAQAAQTMGANYIGLMAAQENEFARATQSGSLLTKAVHETVSSMGEGITIDQLYAAVQQAIVGRSPNIGQHPQLAGNLDHKTEKLGIEGGVTTPGPDPMAELARWVDGAAVKLALATDRSVYRLRETMKASVKVEQDGYLNVINIGEGEEAATVLYPNRTHPDGKVTAGQTIELPNDGSWRMPALLPPGRNQQKVLIVAFLTKEPRNFYQTGFGIGMLKTLNQPQAKQFIAEATGYSAGKALVEIQK